MKKKEIVTIGVISDTLNLWLRCQIGEIT